VREIATAWALARDGDHLTGLQVRRRVVDVALADGTLAAVRIAVDAVDPATGHGVDWAEAWVARVDPVSHAVTVLVEEIPRNRISALRAGRPLRWPAPTDLASTRMAARTVRLLARAGGPAAASPTAVVARYVAEFKNARRFSAFPRLFGPSFRHHFRFPGRSDGFDSFMSVGRDVLGSFHDVSVRVDTLVGEGDLVVEANLVTAVHAKPFAGIPATSRPVSWTEIHFYRVANGRIVENWPSVDIEKLIGSLE
jgi:predicted ester cyclase